MKCLLICKELYYSFLPIFLPSTTTLGIIAGMTTIDYKAKPIELFLHPIGFTFFGIVTGLTYPVSYPMIGTYVLYKNFNKIEDQNPNDSKSN